MAIRERDALQTPPLAKGISIQKERNFPAPTPRRKERCKHSFREKKEGGDFPLPSSFLAEYIILKISSQKQSVFVRCFRHSDASERPGVEFEQILGAIVHQHRDLLPGLEAQVPQLQQCLVFGILHLANQGVDISL